MEPVCIYIIPYALFVECGNNIVICNISSVSRGRIYADKRISEIGADCNYNLSVLMYFSHIADLLIILLTHSICIINYNILFPIMQ